MSKLTDPNMTNRQEIDYRQLEPGREFPQINTTLEPPIISAYLGAVDETGDLHSGIETVPPMAVAALAFGSLAKTVAFPDGTIHVSQEFEFRRVLSVNEMITTRARVSSKRNRGKFCLMTIDIDVFDQHGESALTGKTSFLLPEPLATKG